MIEKTNIPWPIRFNPFKHHRDQIVRMLRDASAEELISVMEPVCNNYIDIYTGNLTPEDIGNEVVRVLDLQRGLQPGDFERWVGSANGYRQIELHDRSVWVVRKSGEAERYIHIHPARTGRFTIRFKGSTLKTIYLLKAEMADPQRIPSLEDVNRSRKEMGLAPVKKLEQSKSILKCYQEFLSWTD